MTELKTLYLKNTKVVDLKLCMLVSEHNLPFRILEFIQSICLESNIVKEIKCSRIKSIQILKRHVIPIWSRCNCLLATHSA